MKLREKKSHSVDFLFVLTTFLLYAASMLALVYLGAGVYRAVSRRMEINFEERTAQSYITEKVRQNDSAGAVSVGELEGAPALILEQSIDGQTYLTYIYAWEGSLRELLVGKESRASAAGGTELLELEALEVRELPGGNLEISLRDTAGEEQSFALHLDSAAPEKES